MENLKLLLEKPLAHRGLHDATHVENSLGAFAQAIDAGLGFELDVHMLKDGTIVVHHDYDMKRLFAFPGKLKEMTIEEVKRQRFTAVDERLPTLAEVLDLAQGRVPILIELKISNGFDPAFPEKLLQVLEKYPFKNQIALQSFNPYAVRWLKQHTNDFPIGQLSSGKLEGQKPHIQFLFKTMLVNRISKPDFVSFDVDYLPSCAIRRLRRRGMPIIAWTVDDDTKRRKASRHADQIIFENLKL